MIWKLFGGGKTAAAPAEDDTLTGPLQAYFDEIAELSATPAPDFFVTAVVQGSARFIQVSVGTSPDGRVGYMFDIPVVDWSRGYIERIETEARARGLEPIRAEGGPMDFLDFDFRDRDSHESFARWVVRDVFGVAEDAQFEINWG